MAKLKLFNALAPYAWQPDIFEGANPPTTATGTTFVFTNANGDTVTIKGKGFKYNTDGVAIGGSVEKVTVTNGADTLLEISKAKVALDDLFALIYGYDRENDTPENPNSFNAFSVFFMGNDTILGSNNGDDLIGGRSLGNDLIKGKGGNDFIKGDAGNDKIDGGAGFDKLSYLETFYDATATKGVKLDAQKGTATDSWGGKDEFKKIEAYEGSKNKDVLKGSDKDEEFGGLRGNDEIDGRGGFDRVTYREDGRFGGGLGIDANLKTGKIKDGWGGTDIVKNVEGVVGTSQDDKFTGNGKDNFFEGGDGIDEYDGGGGVDFVGFWWDGVGDVHVDLEIAGAEVQDDGFGNTEQLTSIEGIGGGDGNDTLRGDDADNQLFGNDGNDTLNGRAGKDYLEGGNGADTFEFDLFGSNNADNVGDMNPDDGDLIALSKAVFGLNGNPGDALDPAQFHVGGNATNANQRIIYNANNGKVFSDDDGNGPNGKQLIATLDNKPTLDANDFVLIA